MTVTKEIKKYASILLPKINPNQIKQLNILFIHRQKCFKIVAGKEDDNYHVIIKYDPPKENHHGNYKYVAKP